MRDAEAERARRAGNGAIQRVMVGDGRTALAAGVFVVMLDASHVGTEQNAGKADIPSAVLIWNDA